MLANHWPAFCFILLNHRLSKGMDWKRIYLALKSDETPVIRASTNQFRVTMAKRKKETRKFFTARFDFTTVFMLNKGLDFFFFSEI